MKLLVGLGNPGPKHAGNRHNVGFMAIDAIAGEHGFAPWRKRFQGEVAEGRLGEEKCLLLKPATYMNDSGRSVGEAARFYKLEPGDVMVFHDELDLAPGKVRVKTGGGNAGHNGLRSITAHFDNDFTRVRIGIGHPGRKEIVYAYVLHDFAKSDADWLEPLIAAMATAAPRLVEGDPARFMTDIAGATQDPGAASRPAAGDRAAGPKRRTAKKWDIVAEHAEDTENAAAEPAAGRSSGGTLADKLKGWLERRDE